MSHACTLPAGAVGTPAESPNGCGRCGTRNQTVRDEWVKQALAAIRPGSRILDAGAGRLRYKPLCAHLEYVSQDFAQYDGRGDGRALHDGTWSCAALDIVSDITCIPQPDDSFDAVLCTEVLEHVPEPARALGELVRLLRHGGTLILTAPFCALTHQSPYFFHTGYSRYYYEYWLPKLGVAIEDLQWNGNYFEYLGQELGRLPWASQTYSKIAPAAHERQALATLLTLLTRLSAADEGSAQLLAYGLHVRGTKQ